MLYTGGVAWGQQNRFKLGGFVFTLSPSASLAYDSNVDDAYPEAESKTLRKDDFYWMPGISLAAAPTRAVRI